MELQDGTYIRLGDNYHRIDIDHGYWVATRETNLDSLSNLTVFGVWVDDDGKQWIDLVSYIEDRDTAITMGQRYQQLSIYDNANKEVIWL